MNSPLFILATPRAYTSLVCGMLGQHPQTYGLPEMNLFSVDRIKDFWELNSSKFGFTSNRRHGLLRTVSELYAGEQSIETIDMARRWCAAREQKTGGEVFTEIVDKLDPLVAIDKSPIYTIEPRFLNRILETFPEARFLHLVRHPISQGSSVMNLFDGAFAVVAHSIDYTEEEAFLDPQLAWHDINVNILEFLTQVPEDRQLHIRGEDIVANPETNLKEICRWLNIRDDEDAIYDMMHPENSPYACLGPINALYGNDPNFLRSAKFKPHTPTPPPLEEPLFWRPDNEPLKPQVRELAMEFGYR